MATRYELANNFSVLRNLANQAATTGNPGGPRPPDGDISDAFPQHTQSDIGWLGAVAFELAEMLADDDRALELVDSNQKPSLQARRIPTAPWEVASFLADGERKQLRREGAPLTWGADNPLSFRHAAASLMVLTKRLAPEAPGQLDEFEHHLRDAVDADYFEATLAACTIAATAGRMLRQPFAARSRKLRRQANRKQGAVSSAPSQPPVAGSDASAYAKVDRLVHDIVHGKDPSIEVLLPPHHDTHDVVDAALRWTEQRLRLCAARNNLPVMHVNSELWHRVHKIGPN